jgi:hypothetical protein
MPLLIGLEIGLRLLHYALNRWIHTVFVAVSFDSEGSSTYKVEMLIFFNIFLIVHLRIILAGDQLDARFFL